MFFLDEIIIKQINAPETYELRLSVLKTCEKYIYKYQGDFDSKTVHFGAFEKNKLIGIVSLMEASNSSFKGKQMQLRGMAVDLGCQGENVGKVLVNQSLLYCKAKNKNILWCNARKQAVSFYVKQGFKVFSEPFNIEHVGVHYKMAIETS